MPKLYKTSRGVYYWNVERVVGPNCRAGRGDILLAQFLLNKAFEYRHRNGLMPFMTVARTGVVDESTQRAIYHFQRNSVWLKPDGRISPMEGGEIEWVPGKMWTIALLQAEYLNSELEQWRDNPWIQPGILANPARHLLHDNEAPDELRTALWTNYQPA